MDGSRREEGENIDCSVLMPVLNEERHIAASVAAMRRQRFDGRLEFIVVDGGSSDRTQELLEQLADQDDRIRVFRNPRRIAASGLNVALREARGKWVARMDAHTEYRDDYLALGVERLSRGDTRWVSGPPIPKGKGPVSRAVALALRTRLGRGGSRKWASEHGADDREYELDAGVFAGVWERQTVLGYGGWDEEWVVNQDSEMAGRFLGQGERLICLPAMAAYYTPRDSLARLWLQYMRYGEYRVKTAVRHPHTLRRSHLLTPGLVVTAAAAALAPAPARVLARIAMGSYGAALVSAGALALKSSRRRGDAALVPVVLAMMHVAHGVGALRGVAHHGVPLAALLNIFGQRRLASALTPQPAPAFAPSLQKDRRSPWHLAPVQ